MAGSGNAQLRGEDVLLAVDDVHVDYRLDRRTVLHAVQGVSFDVRRGETVGIVGESGCGKSTVGRAVVQLPAPTSGTVRLNGVELSGLAPEAMRAARRSLQLIFQDPKSSLNPRRRARDIVGEGLRIRHGRLRPADRTRVEEIMAEVGLDPEVAGPKLPGEFSGGQSQRLCIARALILEPELIVCDEPVSALDVSVQAQILNLLQDMKRRHQLSLVFISHDLAVVRNVSDRVVVMYLGKVCEVAAADALFAGPRHPYTRLLLASVPRAGEGRAEPATEAPAEMPSALNPPSGCRFRTRCPLARDRCAEVEPVVRRIADDHYVACHFAEELAAVGAPAPA